MKIRHLVTLALAGPAIMAANAKASAQCTAGVANAVAVTCPLSQTAEPITRAYSGVDASILGIRTGMTVSQVEAVAAKRGLGKPQETEASLSVQYRGISAQSQSFISVLAYQTGVGNLTIYFGNPVTGNAVYRIALSLEFIGHSDAPFMDVAASAFIKKYGPTSFEDHQSYTWQFGDSSLEKCATGQCPGRTVDQGSPSAAASKIGVVMGIYASLSPGHGYYDSKNGQKVGRSDTVLVDYQAQSESVNLGTQQLKTAVIDYYNRVSDAERELGKNATNVLDVTGAVMGHALVTGCRSDGDGLYAQTFSGADAAENFRPELKYLFEAMFQKYGLGPVTYAGKKYNMEVAAFGEPPGTTNADLTLDPVKGNSGKIWWGNTLVNGSITITDFGSSRAVTFDHAVLKPSGNTKGMPPNATVTINGKAYCKGGAQPFPPDLVVPTQTLTGTYYAGVFVLSNGEKTTVSLDFVSGTAVNLQSVSGQFQGTYKFNGSLLLIQFSIDGNMHRAGLKLDGNGCFDSTGPDNTELKLCNMTAQKLAAAKAMKVKQEQEKAAAIAAKKKKELELVPKF